MSRVAVCINSQLTAMIQNHVREVVPKQQKVVPQLFHLENAYINKNSKLPSYLLYLEQVEQLLFLTHEENRLTHHFSSQLIQVVRIPLEHLTPPIKVLSMIVRSTDSIPVSVRQLCFYPCRVEPLFM